MHKVVGYKSGDDFDPHGNKMDFCPECGAIIEWVDEEQGE